VQTPATLRELDADHCIATWNRTLIQIWRRGWTASAMAEARRIGRLFIAEQPQPIALLLIVEASAQVPSAPARKELGQFIEETASAMACAVVVSEGGEFRAAVVRAVKDSLQHVMRGPGFYKFAATVDEAVDHMAPHLGPAPGGPEDLRQALTALRAQIAVSSREP
jgi:hypothetical protein